MDACVHDQMRGHMDTTQTNPTTSQPAKRSWRRHADEFKARVIAQACQPGTSVAAVALANGLNANMLRRWVRECELATERPAVRREPSLPGGGFVQLPIACAPTTLISQAALTTPVPETVALQIDRGGTRVVVSVPLDSASAAWLRELLR
jgi:transposase